MFIKQVRKSLIIFMVLLAGGLVYAAGSKTEIAEGYVYHDRNMNGIRDSKSKGIRLAVEEGIKGIRVSNGRDIVLTDNEGKYRILVDNDDPIFVIKPEGWRTTLDKDNLPRFYYLHKPNGSPGNFKYSGVAPTGKLPDSIDFPLYPQDESGKFKVIMFGDTQARNQKEINFNAHDVVEELIGTDAVFGVTLGDVIYDNLSLYDSHNGVVSKIGIPWYNVHGNHDQNYDAKSDEHADETFERVFGPSYYSFDYGSVHFIVLDDIDWYYNTKEEKYKYRGGIGTEQLNFVRNDLKLVPDSRLVVLMMHIPIYDINMKENLFHAMESHSNVISISGHTHYQQHCFLSGKDGWHGKQPHHHIVNVTVCGSWWAGALDERGIPHTTMRDGAPNGYSIMTFNGIDYEWEFKASGSPADYQMNIYAPDEIYCSGSSDTEVYANIFGGSEASSVLMRIGEDGKWIKMQRTEEPDPYYVMLKESEESKNPPTGRKLPNAIKSDHLWKAKLPKIKTPGIYLINVKTTDMFGHEYEDNRIIKIKQ